MKDPNKDIGPWAALEDVREPEDRYVLVKASRLLDRGGGLIVENKWRCPRSNPSSANKVAAWNSTTNQVLGNGQLCLGG